MRSKIRNLLLENSEISAYPWLLYFDTLDSTNNYAMGLVQDGLAQHGTVVLANHQSNGKGQRGKQWLTFPGDAIAMSLLLGDYKQKDIYHLSYLIPVSVLLTLQTFMPSCQLSIKWPNDIYVNDKKLAGILIENVIRGQQIPWSVIGIGINMYQTDFDQNLPSAISIFQALGTKISVMKIVENIRSNVIDNLNLSLTDLMYIYNANLFKRNQSQHFIDSETNQIFNATIIAVDSNFNLTLLMVDGSIIKKMHGSIQFINKH